MKKFFGISVSLLLVAFMAQAAGAAIIEYEANFLGGASWQYDYTIYNDSTDDVIAGFDIYYAYGDYNNVDLLSVPLGWDGFSDNPFDMGFIEDGLVAIWLDGYGLMPGENAGIFSVTFDWFGDGLPSGQWFFAYDVNWGIIGEGDVVPGVPGSTEPIPEPQTFMLLGTGILGLAAYYRSRKGKR